MYSRNNMLIPEFIKKFWSYVVFLKHFLFTSDII